MDMPDDIKLEIIELISPIISESVTGKTAIVKGITLKGPITRNRNYYPAKIKKIIAERMVGKPFLFGAPMDHVNPSPDQDIRNFYVEFRMKAAKFIVGHITEAAYDPRIDAIRFEGTARNTLVNPNFIELLVSKDVGYVSIGGVGERVTINHPKYGIVKQVVDVDVTHTSYVAIPGDPDSRINTVIIEESFDPKNIDEVKAILNEDVNSDVTDNGNSANDQNPNDNAGTQPNTDPLNDHDNDKEGVKGVKGVKGDDVKKDDSQPNNSITNALLKRLQEIEKQRDELAKKLGLSEEERERLKQEAEKLAKTPTLEDLQILEAQIKDVEEMRSEIKKFKEERKKQLQKFHEDKVLEVLSLMNIDDEDSRTAKFEQLVKLPDSALDTMKETLEEENMKIEEMMKNAQKNRPSGRITLGNQPRNRHVNFEEQYKTLTAEQKDQLWEIWRQDTLRRMSKA